MALCNREADASSVHPGKWVATKIESLLYSVGISEGFQVSYSSS